MAAIARVLSRTGTEIDIEEIKSILILCGAGLAVSLLLVSYGLDLGFEFF
jgi:hypothetical protein